MTDNFPHKAIIEIKNINLRSCTSFEINDYFSILQGKNNAILAAKIAEMPNVFSAPTIFLNALFCAFPDVLVSTWCKDADKDYYKDLWKPNILFSYYGFTEYKSNCKKVADVEDLHHLKMWHKMLIEHNENCRKNPESRGTTWNIALNEYLDATSCGVVEKAFIHLITALEALLVDGSNELNYRVALFTAIIMKEAYDERIETFSFVKKCYSLRSKAVHGDVEGLKKSFKNEVVYEMLFDLKSIVASILFRTYGKNKELIVSAIDKVLFGCSSVIM